MNTWWRPCDDGLGRGTEQFFVGGLYCGWVALAPAVGLWICNWIGTWPDRVPWHDPYAGDSIGHLFPTIDAAKAAVEHEVAVVIQAAVMGAGSTS